MQQFKLVDLTGNEILGQEWQKFMLNILNTNGNIVDVVRDSLFTDKSYTSMSIKKKNIYSSVRLNQILFN